MVGISSPTVVGTSFRGLAGVRVISSDVDNSPASEKNQLSIYYGGL